MMQNQFESRPLYLGWVAKHRVRTISQVFDSSPEGNAAYEEWSKYNLFFVTAEKSGMPHGIYIAAR